MFFRKISKMFGWSVMLGGTVGAAASDKPVLNTTDDFIAWINNEAPQNVKFADGTVGYPQESAVFLLGLVKQLSDAKRISELRDGFEKAGYQGQASGVISIARDIAIQARAAGRTDLVGAASSDSIGSEPMPEIHADFPLEVAEGAGGLAMRKSEFERVARDIDLQVKGMVADSAMRSFKSAGYIGRATSPVSVARELLGTALPVTDSDHK